ncbi:hypothetical protein DIPPA_10229 [Diplonema papillatum]|nr:hypothetical protein DIPPA_10229 [Diplonema papillatum]|eukprot:gene6211-9513_t
MFQAAAAGRWACRSAPAGARHRQQLLQQQARPRSDEGFVERFRRHAEAGVARGARVAAGLAAPVPPVDRQWGWAVENTPGSDCVVVRRRDEAENVEVHVKAELKVQDLTRHGGTCAEVFPLTLLVTTETGCLRFDCVSADCTLRILTSQAFPLQTPETPDPVEMLQLQAAFGLDADSEARRGEVYHLPSWDNLPDDLLAAFQRFLAELGVTPEFLEYVAMLLQHKECVEYPAWWAKISAFLDADAQDPHREADKLLPAGSLPQIEQDSRPAGGVSEAKPG